MDWVKSLTGYYRLLEIATGTDAMEVMFKRADALAGELGSNGFIPDAMLPHLTRRPAQAKKTADQLAKTGLWVRVRGGYLIVDWESINSELVKLHDRKKRDRDRKRASRAASRDESEDVSADSPADGHEDSLLIHRGESQRKTAAAAAGAAAAAELPGDLAILQAKLQAHTPLRGLRFDSLTTEQTSQLLELVDLHGDGPLVDVAISTCRNPAPTYVTAFLGTWAALPPPGRPLHVVRTKTCPTHNQRLTPAGVCTYCAAEGLATKENR